MLEKQIATFEVADEIQGFFLVKSINLKTSSNNKKYLDLTVVDKTGEINGKVWDAADELIQSVKSGTIVKIRGTVTSWQNNKQLKIVKIRAVDETDEVNMEELVQSAPIHKEAMYEEVKDYIRKIKNEELRLLVTTIISEYEERLMYYPAAKKNHHAIRSGLLYHILRMLRTAEVLCTVYEHLDQDLLIAGVILHDIEKINEMYSDEMGVVSDYSFEGNMLGHIIMGIRKIQRVGEDLGIDQELSNVIQHMILSHHYEPEFGSPKKPMLPEAEILHYLDMIDARMYDMNKAVSGVEPGHFSDMIPVLDFRKIYKPKFNAPEEGTEA